MIIDASAVLKGFFPDEEGQLQAQALIRAYAQEEIELLAPTLLPYEVANAALQAVRRGRISLGKAGISSLPFRVCPFQQPRSPGSEPWNSLTLMTDQPTMEHTWLWPKRAKASW